MVDQGRRRRRIASDIIIVFLIIIIIVFLIIIIIVFLIVIFVIIVIFLIAIFIITTRPGLGVSTACVVCLGQEVAQASKVGPWMDAPQRGCLRHAGPSAKGELTVHRGRLRAAHP